MTGIDIVNNALQYTSGLYCYWYGGKRQKCSTALLNQLAKLYPGVYTKSYTAKCKQDIANGLYCVDCSGLVCGAYRIDDIGTVQMETDSRFKRWTGEPLNGMIVWRKSHVGIYYNGYVIEARGVDYDVTTNRKYKASEWSRVYYVAGTDYGNSVNPTASDYIQAVKDTWDGKYGNGEYRVNLLTNAGFKADVIQQIINILAKEV